MSSISSNKHADGTTCPEGTQALPRGFQSCCDAFHAHTAACYFDIRYEWWPRSRSWFIVIAPSAGGGGISIRFCPHCGNRLTAMAPRARNATHA